MCAAVQQWWLAIGTTLLALLVLRGLFKIEKRMGRRSADGGASGADGDAGP